jgi:hypothetical protein
MTAPRALAQALAVSPAAALAASVAAARRAARALAPECARLGMHLDLETPGRCELRGTKLVVRVPSAAQSTKLRQALPRLVEALRAEGIPVEEIALRVQPLGDNEPPAAAVDPARYGPPRAPSAPGARAVGALALALPVSDLRRALERLEKTLARSGG